MLFVSPKNKTGHGTATFVIDYSEASVVLNCDRVLLLYTYNLFFFIGTVDAVKEEEEAAAENGDRKQY